MRRLPASLTASWSRGERQRYPYYHCGNRGCVRYGRTIPKARLEEELEEVLRGLEASEGAMEILDDLLRGYQRQRTLRQVSVRKEAEAALKIADAEIAALADRLAETHSAAVASALERRIEKMEERRAELMTLAGLKEGMSRKNREGEIEDDTRDAGTPLASVREMLKSPLQTWKQVDLAGQRAMLRLVFAGPPVYDRETGYGTVDLTLPYLVLGQLTAAMSQMVDPEGNRSNVANLAAGIDWEELARTFANWAATIDGAAAHRFPPFSETNLTIPL